MVGVGVIRCTAPEFRSPDGRFTYGGLASVPTVARNRDGRLEAFAIGSRDPFTADLVHIWQPAANSGPWSGWASLGGDLKAIAPAVGRNADGRLEVFACTRDHALWHIWQTAPNNGWSQWQRLGGVVLGAPAVVENADGRLELFVRSSDYNLWHIWQVAPNSVWSGWASLSGPMLSNPVVVRNRDGRLEVFAAVGMPHPWPLGHIWQLWPNGPWSHWVGDLLVENAFESPSVGENADGRLEVFGNGYWLGALQHQWQTWPNLVWSWWNTSADRTLGGVPHEYRPLSLGTPTDAWKSSPAAQITGSTISGKPHRTTDGPDGTGSATGQSATSDAPSMRIREECGASGSTAFARPHWRRSVPTARRTPRCAPPSSWKPACSISSRRSPA